MSEQQTLELTDEEYKIALAKYEEDLKEYNKRLDECYDKHKAETEKRQISSSENFDKSVLTYASWALGISIAFLKDFVPITIANVPCLLYISWYLFIISIGLTTSSFLISYKSLEISLDHAYKYYKERNQEYANKKSGYTKVVEWFNLISAVCFILGMIFTVIFASANLEKAAMSKKTIPGLGQDGMPPNLITKVLPPGDFTKGITPSGITKVTLPPPAPPAPPPKTSSK